MSGTPLRYDPSRKRDSLAAELERDPHLSTAKRQQRTQVFNSTISHATLERQLLAAQTANAEYETKLRQKELHIERLERDRRWFAEREKEEREEKERERAVYDESKRKSDTELRTLRTALTALREEHADLLDAHSTLTRTSAQTAASQKSAITTLTHRISLLTDELAHAHSTTDAHLATLTALRTDYDALTAQHEILQQSVSEQEHMGVVRDELHRQAVYLRALEGKNAKMQSELSGLRERHESVEVLREEKRGLETKLVVLSELREKVVRLEAELLAARSEREEWAASASSAEVTQSLSDLRLAHARLLEEHGATLAALRRREAEVSNLEKAQADLQEAMGAVEEELRTVKEELRRREARTVLAEREVGYFEALLASYKSEEAYANNAPSVDETKLARIADLESLLVEYKVLNDQLLANASASPAGRVSQKDIAKLEEEKATLQTTINTLQTAVQTHLTTIDTLEQSLFDLTGEIAGGRHVPPKTRVLCMRENPDQEWVDTRREEMERLRGENAALLRRLGEVEDELQSRSRSGGSGLDCEGGEGTTGTGETPNLVPKESYDLLLLNTQTLSSSLAQKEKRLLRLQQVFASKSAEFREAIASILGLKLAFYPNGQVRVTSVFDLNASFIFQPANKSEGAKMTLVGQGEGGPEELDDLVRYWIESEQCTPGFLASVTLECYDHWKRKGGADVGES